MAAKHTSKQTDTDDGAEHHPPPPPPVVTPSAVSTKETDYLGRSLITPGTVSKDYMGRLTTATADYMGLLLLDV